MKAVTWHGRRDVRVEEVPDPILKEPNDAIVRITSSGLCGSDLHLYETLGPFMGQGDVLGHEPMGIVEEVGKDLTDLRVGDRVVLPFQICCGSCWMCDRGLYTQCETTQVRDQGMGAALFGFSKLYGEVPGAQAELLRVPQAQFMPIKVPEGPADERFLFLSDVLPTAWQSVVYADVPDGGTLLVLGLGPIGEMATRIALHQGIRVIAVDLVPERLARARSRGAEVIDLDAVDDVAEEVRSRTQGRGADSVIDAVGMEAHGSPVAEVGQRIFNALPQKLTAPIMRRVGLDRMTALYHRDRRGAPRRHRLGHRRVRRPERPDAGDDDVRQADPAADGPGQREALGRRHHAPARGRRRPARDRAVRDPHRAAERGARGVRQLPEEDRRHDQGRLQALTLTRSGRPPATATRGSRACPRRAHGRGSGAR